MERDPGGSVPRPTRFSDNAATILATEHWNVFGTRSMTWAEASSRTTVFLTVLSAAVVSLALVADATGFEGSFLTFALVLLPVVLFLGVATFARLVQINAQDAYYVIAMNRIRHAYLELAPELEPYFTTSQYDDQPGIVTTYSFGETRNFRPWLQFLMTSPTVIASINSALFAAGASLIVNRLTGFTPALVGICAIVFLTSWVLHFLVQLRPISIFRRHYVPRFPSNGTEQFYEGSGQAQ